MAQCKACGKKGWLLSLEKETQLCSSCHQAYTMSLQSIVRVINQSYEIAEESKSLKTAISRCDVVIDRAKQLQQLNEQFMVRGATSVNPKELIERAEELKRNRISEVCLTKVGDLVQKAELSSSPSTKVSSLEKALLELNKAQQDVGESADITRRIEEAKKMLSLARAGKHSDKAKRYEFKKQWKSALSAYQDALFELKSDDVPDEEQQVEIDGLEGKIREMEDNLS